MTMIDACAAPPALLTVLDDVLPRPEAYRAWALSHTFETIVTGEEQWHGIALLTDATLGRLVQRVLPESQTRLSFFRRSPLGQEEPNFIHSDEGMGEWTAVLYLNPEPPAADGTTFWRFEPTGAVLGSARALDKDAALWTPWHHVPARFNRVLVYDSRYFHSRAIAENYGVGETARLIQVAFGAYPSRQAPPSAIRPATLSDIQALLVMGQRFGVTSGYSRWVPHNPTQLRALAERLITEATGVLLVVERAGALVGMIGVVLFPHHLSGALTAGELFFWVSPEHRGVGVRLLRHAEAWARDHGATMMQMVAPTEDVERLYAHLGYERLEVAYVKELTP
jgi:GNAT superfamily N-acetyltransferase